jgi:hypothetical protein
MIAMALAFTIVLLSIICLNFFLLKLLKTLLNVTTPALVTGAGRFIF